MRGLKDYATPIAVLILAAVMLFDHCTQITVVPSDPSVNIDAGALGKAYATDLVATYADAWNAAATTLEQGKTVSEAQKALQDTWKDGRTKAFKAKVEPALSQMLPEGTEPADAAKRAQVVQLWRAFAKGLTKAR
jgi:hypothetical protein